jgi:hypothetical protein
MDHSVGTDFRDLQEWGDETLAGPRERAAAADLPSGLRPASSTGYGFNAREGGKVPAIWCDAACGRNA